MMSAAGEALRGRIALVTGAGSGIGRAVSEHLVAAGARVICAGRRYERVQSVAQALGDAALPLALDVTDAESVAALPGGLPEAWCDVDILVNNAGHDTGGRRRFDQGDADAWADIIETNVVGLMRVTRALLPAMIRRDNGHVVNLGSTAGLHPYPTGTAYAASKHAVHGFSESLRLDCAGTGVRVSEILPGMVRTEFAYARWPDDAQRATRFYDERRNLAPADVARAILYVLCEPPGVEIAQLVIRPKGER